MNDDVFAQMMEGLRGVSGGKKKKLQFDPPEDPSVTKVDLPETEIPPLKYGDPIDPNTFIGPPAPVEGVTGPSGPDGSTATQGAVNRIDLNAQDEAQAKLPPPAQMMPLPEPQAPPAVIHTEAGLGKKPSSEQRAQAPRLAAQEQRDVVESGTSKEERPSGPDSRMSALDDRQKGVDRERMKSLEEAANSRNMSSEEMLAMALVTLLPTLVGGIAGGALAGKGGATAGIAGGLQGGSQGFNNLIAQKQKDKEAATAEAARLGQRSDALEGEKGQRQGQLETLAEHEKVRGSNKEIALIKEKGDSQRAAASNATHLKAANIQAYSHLKGAQIAADSAIAKAEARAKQAEESGDLKDYQGKASGFAGKMLASEHILRNIKDPALINSFADWGTLQNALADPKQQVAARATLNFLDAIARDESGAAINEKEWGRYFSQYMGRNTSSPEDMAYAQKMRGVAIKGMLGKAGRIGSRIAIESYQDEFGTPQQAGPQGGQGQQPGAQQQAPNDKPLTSKWGAGR